MIKLKLKMKGYRAIVRKFPHIKLIRESRNQFKIDSNDYDVFIQIGPFAEESEFEEDPEPERMYAMAS